MSTAADRIAAADYDRAPGRTTLIFADDPALRARLAAAATIAGGRIGGEGAAMAATQAIAAQAGTTALVLAPARDDGEALDALFGAVGDGVAAARLDAVVIVPAALIDVAAARLDAGTVTLLVDPADAEIAAALARIVAAPVAGVAEPTRDERRRLAELAEETARIARALAGLAQDGATPAATAIAADPATILATTRGLIRTRRMREQFFDATLFADPAWDMLLDLFAARLERREVAVSSLCIAAAVPATTALRWIALMTAQGLIERRPDPGDRRRMFLALADRAADAMTGYVAATLRHLAPA